MDNKFKLNKEKNKEYNERLNENLSQNEKTKNNYMNLVKTLLISSAFTSNLLVAQSLTDLDINKLNNYSNKITEIKTEKQNKIEQIYEVNNYVNKFRYKSDQENYGKNDYYASPLEMIKKGAGDCEDFAILKYNILVKEFGINPKDLGFMYGQYGPNKIPHMVLSFKANGDDYILDNTTNKITKLEDHPTFTKMFEVSNNKVLIGSKSEELHKDSKYSKLMELSLPTNLSNTLEHNKGYITLSSL